ncbi:hypothetical protein [Acidithiobacillus ferrianus]|uniref:hypothetical protein n=1 Tax=Acidithiobacillus ferrianus TaxID=2678518 RepID=UPI0034E5E699
MLPDTITVMPGASSCRVTLLMGLTMRGGPGNGAARIDGTAGALSHAGRGLAS